jgi:hypothetical protein
MGKLAERLSDPVRAGVYRIVTTEAVVEAAALNGYALVFVDGTESLESAATGRNRVIVVRGVESLEDERIARLNAAAAAWREHGARVFVAFLDPAGRLASLPPLYNWSASRAMPSSSASTSLSAAFEAAEPSGRHGRR